MHYFSYLFILFLILILSPLQASAQGHDMYCEKADSTAALQDCLKQHLGSAQKRLNKVYQSLIDKYEGADSEALSDLQRQWLAYRDAECTWEASQSETPALKRTNELSCMARVTDDRADILSTVLMDKDQPDQAREYGSFPRWMNVIAKDKNNIFWDYRNRMRGDLNCDGEDEHFMLGISPIDIAGSDTESEEAVPVQANTSVTLAIASYPSIGKPKVSYLDFPVLNKESSEGLCDPYVSIQIEKSAEIEEVSAEGQENSKCHAQLIIKDKKCASKSIVWTGKSYDLEIKQSDNKESENKNE